MDLYLDCVGGVAGDMLLGALCELHESSDLLRSVPERLGLQHVEVQCTRASRHHLSALQVTVKVSGDQPSRRLSDIRALLDAAQLPAAVRAAAGQVFHRLAVAEAAVHGSTVEGVHFHEVGAADALVDIAGTCLLLQELHPGRVTGSPLPLAGGSVQTAHGEMPLPAPAVLELLKGWPVEWIEEPGEWVTPTGAALLVTLAECAWPAPGSIHKSGYGAGARDSRSRANVVRALLLEPRVPQGVVEAVTELCCVIDNRTGEDLAFAMEILLGEGALDVYYAPAVMKKGRPGWELGVICRAAQADRLAATVLRYSGSSGVRRRDVVRYVLPHTVCSVDTRFGAIRVKLLGLADGTVRPAPEFEDCRKAALEHRLTVAEVRQEAVYRWQQSESTQ
jgi:uncharacterized protein (TIGR00299 family) protein